MKIIVLFFLLFAGMSLALDEALSNMHSKQEVIYVDQFGQVLNPTTAHVAAAAQAENAQS